MIESELGGCGDNGFIWRQATNDDFVFVWEIILEAKAMMASSGRNQWNEHYPIEENIRTDIKNGLAYVLCKAKEIAAYGVVVRNGEPEYEKLVCGAWLSEGDYYVVHRLAVAEKFRGQGVAQVFLEFVSEICRTTAAVSIRVDTNYDNQPMISVLQKTGFQYCGKVVYPVNGERCVYEKVVS